ncbi:hypothetical protein [Haloarcula argentinensis]|uniref:Uncharacterized protein n=1 Tax=Haloarcula argentinensis TaxID=43776 RepID=A0A847URN0_HALAR|nr:hypothetical protein [Haloarcula argentinensis]NLV14348.1 hypothetical protein [Haloarcula argentinensis]
MTDAQHADVLVQTGPEDVAHKRRENMDNPDEMQCYWTVSGTPRKTGRGGAMLFSDGESVWGTATITEVEDGKIWFRPIRTADGLSFDLPIDPPTRGFAYITEEMVE